MKDILESIYQSPVPITNLIQFIRNDTKDGFLMILAKIVDPKLYKNTHRVQRFVLKLQLLFGIIKIKLKYNTSTVLFGVKVPLVGKKSIFGLLIIARIR